MGTSVFSLKTLLYCLLNLPFHDKEQELSLRNQIIRLHPMHDLVLLYCERVAPGKTSKENRMYDVFLCSKENRIYSFVRRKKKLDKRFVLKTL